MLGDEQRIEKNLKQFIVRAPFIVERNTLDILSIKIFRCDIDPEMKIYYKDLSWNIKYEQMLISCTAEWLKLFEKKLILYIPQMIVSSKKENQIRVDYAIKNRNKEKISLLWDSLIDNNYIDRKYITVAEYFMNMYAGENISPLYFIGGNFDGMLIHKLYFLLRECNKSDCIYKHFRYYDSYYYEKLVNYFSNNGLDSDLFDQLYKIIMTLRGHLGLLSMSMQDMQNIKIYFKKDEGFDLCEFYRLAYGLFPTDKMRKCFQDYAHWLKNNGKYYCVFIGVEFQNNSIKSLSIYLKMVKNLMNY